jgi:dihydrofolate synthase/folylpolyglutamate synthase
MDHEQYLGDTLSQIATEKAGIIKKKTPVVSAVADDDSGEIVKKVCNELQAPLYLFGREFTGEQQVENSDCWQFPGIDGKILDDLPMAMKGSYQVSNASLALAAVQLLQQQGYGITDDHIRTGLARTSWPGRLESLQINGLRFLLDGAHNPAGVSALKQALTDEFSYKRLLLIWGAMADKDLQTTLREIVPLSDMIIFTRPESERSATAEQLQTILPAALQKKAVCTATAGEAIAHARTNATADDLICIAGSLYLVGAARHLLVGALTDDG